MYARNPIKKKTKKEKHMQGEIWSYKALPSPLDPLWTKPTALQMDHIYCHPRSPCLCSQTSSFTLVLECFSMNN